jgi:membrane-bound lytic murein transglycosylase A
MTKLATLLILRVMRIPALFLLLLLTACADLPPSTPEAVYAPLGFNQLPGWGSDSLFEAKPALDASCARLTAIPADRSLGADGRMGKAGDWLNFCAALKTASTAAQLKTLLETQLTPYSVSAGGNSQGLFTGYYESELRGSLTQHGPYQTPLYARPTDLVMVDLGEFRPELKGQRIAGSVQNGQLKPYANRANIVSGKLAEKNLELIWLDDPVDAFFVQIQGSGRVKLDDGREVRIGYAAQNGHPYVAIGKTLIAKGALTPESVSMQSIRAWLEANPQEAATVMNSNPSYVFFQLQPDGGGPLGAANVPLTPLRSLAVDNRYIGYHVPVWVDLKDVPTMASSSEAVGLGGMTRLFVAQDTGGAIRGIVRGDVFWGHGAEAQAQAGLMKSRGQYYVLLPKLLPKP